MRNYHENAEEKRERLRQKELRHPSSGIHGSGLSDLIGSLGWKGTGVIILVILAGFLIYAVLFR